MPTRSLRTPLLVRRILTGPLHLFDFTLKGMSRQVRPDFAEAALMRAYRSSSVRDHLLARYRNAFAAIVLAQLQNKGFKDGMQVRDCFWRYHPQAA